MFVIPAVLFYYGNFVTGAYDHKSLALLMVIECEEGDVCLVDSNMNTSASGRVEMCLGNDWRVVGNGTWGVEEASVVCTQLGLPNDGWLTGSYTFMCIIVQHVGSDVLTKLILKHRGVCGVEPQECRCSCKL